MPIADDGDHNDHFEWGNITHIPLERLTSSSLIQKHQPRDRKKEVKMSFFQEFKRNFCVCMMTITLQVEIEKRNVERERERDREKRKFFYVIIVRY